MACRLRRFRDDCCVSAAAGKTYTEVVCIINRAFPVEHDLARSRFNMHARRPLAFDDFNAADALPSEIAKHNAHVHNNSRVID